MPVIVQLDHALTAIAALRLVADSPILKQIEDAMDAAFDALTPAPLGAA